MSETRERVADLIESGLSVREIARALSISTQAVYKHLKVLDVPPPSRRDDDGEAA